MNILSRDKQIGHLGFDRGPNQVNAKRGEQPMTERIAPSLLDSGYYPEIFADNLPRIEVHGIVAHLHRSTTRARSGRR